jgi:hypothetical protein
MPKRVRVYFNLWYKRYEYTRGIRVSRATIEKKKIIAVWGARVRLLSIIKSPPANQSLPLM